jgi:hypothetical protein
MKQNVGALDATIRVGVGFGLLFVAFLLQPPASGVAYVAALVVTISGFAGKCLLYRLFGMDTNRT